MLHRIGLLHSMRLYRGLALVLLAIVALAGTRTSAQGALLLEEPYGFFGALNPTGHTAIYLARVCAATPVSLRRCHPGELGSVISRYQGIKGYDWIAIPLLPYLYSVKSTSEVPVRVDPDMVRRLRDHYHETGLAMLGPEVKPGGFLSGGWKELIGVSYERRIYAFRFNTAVEQDDRLIAVMNAGPNQSSFNLLYSNCADFARNMLDFYFPGTFNRSIFPDAGMTTPKQIAYKLTRSARKHPEIGLTVYELPQIPGLRRHSRSNKNIAESLVTTSYAVPLIVVSPYLAGGIFVDYLVRGHRGIIPKHPEKLDAGTLYALTEAPAERENRVHAGLQVSGASSPVSIVEKSGPGLREGSAAHE